MSVESDFVASMLSHAPLAALIGDRLVPDKVEQGAPRPYIVYVVEREPEYLLDSALATTRYRFRVQCWGDTRTQCEQVADELEAAMQASTMEEGGLLTETRDTIAEHNLDLEGTEIAFDFWQDA